MNSNIILGMIMTGIGISVAIVQVKVLSAKKHTPGDSIDRLLIGGIGFIIIGIVMVVKNI